MRSRPGPVARVLLALVRAYQYAVSPLLAARCRYLPTCSAYAAEALEVHGARRGVALAVRRLARCHPFVAGGVDPVPPPRRSGTLADRPATAVAAGPNADPPTRPVPAQQRATPAPGDASC